jgi:hypothetical protein
MSVATVMVPTVKRVVMRANIAAGNCGPPGSARRTRVAARPVGFRADAAQPFDVGCLSWQFPDAVGGREATISIWTMRGRLRHIRVLAAANDLVLLRTRKIGETDLIYRDGKWFLHATFEVPDAQLAEPVNGFLGVDMGIVNIATTSTGQRASGARLNRYRKRQARLRKRLQAKKTSSARRLLKKRRRKEARFAADLNHLISYTSQTCSACGWVDKHNRRTQAVFECGRCRFVGHADHNAAINIAARGVERWGEVMRPHAAPTLAAS